MNWMSTLSLKPEKTAYNEIKKIMRKSPVITGEGFALDVSLEVSPQLYLHSSEDESSWVYGYEARPPVLAIPFEAWYNEGFYASFEPALGESRFRIIEKDSDGNYTEICPISLWLLPRLTTISPNGRSSLPAGVTGMFRSAATASSTKRRERQAPVVLLCGFLRFLRIKGFAGDFAFTWTYLDLQN